METYQCTICHSCKTAGEFGKRSGRRNTQCKDCYNRKKREYDARNKEKKKSRDLRWRERHPEKARECDKKKDKKFKKKNQAVLRAKARNRAAVKRENNREFYREKQRKYYEQNKEKFKNYRELSKIEVAARRKVSYEVAKGRLTKPDHCQNCGKKTRLEAHHHDYSKPLDVIWVCRPCHNQIHVNINLQRLYDQNRD